MFPLTLDFYLALALLGEKTFECFMTDWAPFGMLISGVLVYRLLITPLFTISAFLSVRALRWISMVRGAFS